MNDTENIIYPAPKQDYKVLVRCFTYNQSKYIEDALNGFAMQQTNFPYVCLVMDDASMDGEQAVIKAWMERECDMDRAETIDTPISVVIIVPHKINTSCTFAVYLLKQNLFKAQEEKLRHVTPWRRKCVYEAICEGDDYWIDSLKLQKQVDFLDANPGYSMCYSSVYYFYQKNNKLSNKIEGGSSESFKELINRNVVPTPTVLIRTLCLIKYIDEINPNSKDWKIGDYPMWLYFSHLWKVKYMQDEIFSVYRYLDESASHTKDSYKKQEFIINTYEIAKFFTGYFLKEELYDEDNLYRSLFNNAFLYGNLEEAKHLYKSIIKKTKKTRIKYILCHSKFLYELFSGTLYFSIK